MKTANEKIDCLECGCQYTQRVDLKWSSLQDACGNPVTGPAPDVGLTDIDAVLVNAAPVEDTDALRMVEKCGICGSKEIRKECDKGR